MTAPVHYSHSHSMLAKFAQRFPPIFGSLHSHSVHLHATDPGVGLMLLSWPHFDHVPFAHLILAKCCDFRKFGQGFASTFAFSNFQWPGTAPLILTTGYLYCHTSFYPFLRTFRSLRPEFRLIFTALNAISQSLLYKPQPSPVSTSFSMFSKECAFLAFKQHSAAVHVNPDWSMVWWHPVSRHVLIMSQSLCDIAT